MTFVRGTVCGNDQVLIMHRIILPMKFIDAWQNKDLSNKSEEEKNKDAPATPKKDSKDVVHADADVVIEKKTNQNLILCSLSVSEIIAIVSWIWSIIGNKVIIWLCSKLILHRFVDNNFIDYYFNTWTSLQI